MILFTDWQVAKLVQGIRTYRVMKAENGRRPSWERVVEHLVESGATPQGLGLSGQRAALRPEALRRFAEQKSVLEPEHLQDVRLFLVHAKVLTETDFTDDNHVMHEAVTVHRCLARLAQGMDTALPVPGTAWQATQSGADEREEISLVFIAKPTDSLALVEERSTIFAIERPDWASSKSVERRVQECVRRGYAFFASDKATMHIFVRGYQADDLLHYVQLAHYDPYGWMRTGKEPRVPYGRNGDTETQLRACGFVTLKPVYASAPPRVARQ